MRGDLLRSLLNAGITPVLAPIGYGEGGAAYNINADTMAGAAFVARVHSASAALPQYVSARTLAQPLLLQSALLSLRESKAAGLNPPFL